MNKLLIICGPTATGKTKLAIKLAKKFNGEIISADSRQVYSNMDIGTGRGLGPEFVRLETKLGDQILPFYSDTHTKIWGYDLVSPLEEFSVGQFTKTANLILRHICSQKKLPILVGGTGLYLKSLTQQLETVFIPPNRSLRDRKSVV